jgi:membrane protein YdbS with pleckstrin-like domain
LGHSLKTYGRLWLITGVILIAAGAFVLAPSERPSAQISRWPGIVAAALAAISAIFVMPHYPVWSLIYIAIAIMVSYGFSARYWEQGA